MQLAVAVTGCSRAFWLGDLLDAKGKAGGATVSWGGGQGEVDSQRAAAKKRCAKNRGGFIPWLPQIFPPSTAPASGVRERLRLLTTESPLQYEKERGTL